MSIERYDLCHPETPGFSSLVLPVEEGKYVLYTDYLKLQEAFTKSCSRMTTERFIDKFKEDKNPQWDGDNAFQGLQIIAKYIDPKKTYIICAAEHDIIYSVDIDELVEAGITEEDVYKLVNLNWMIEDNTYLSCFV